MSFGRLQEPPSDAARESFELGSLASSEKEAHQDRGSGESSSSTSGVASSRRLSLSLDDPLYEGSNDTGPGQHGRSFSASSAFDFAPNLFPLSSTAAGYSAIGAAGSGGATTAAGNVSLEKHKSLTYVNGLSLVIGLIIGSGIFSSPAQVNLNAGSHGASLLVWTISGLLVWTGAASYAELGGAIPLNGGSQVYLSKIYGDLAGFLFSWCAVFVLKPGSAAIISIIFGEYVVRAILGAESNMSSIWLDKAVAILGLCFITGLNCISTRLGTRMGDLFMLMKFFALAAITVIGIVVAATGKTLHSAPATDWKTSDWFEGTSTDPSSWAVALYAGLWAYDGWDNTNFVVGEFVNPRRDLPRVIHTAMPLVLVSYLAANIAYIFVLPKNVITSSNTIAVKFGSAVFGPAGSIVLALIVSASCLGALNAQTFTSGRLVYAAGKEGFLPSFLGEVGRPGLSASSIHRDPESGPKAATSAWKRRVLRCLTGKDAAEHRLGFTPMNAMAANALLTMIYIVIGEFGTLVTFSGVAAYSFYFLTVLGLIVLRYREPYLERPYRTWIVTPIVFCCVSLFLLSRAVFAKPAQVGIVLLFVLAGIPVYFWRVRQIGIRSQDLKRAADDRPWWSRWKFWSR